MAQYVNGKRVNLPSSASAADVVRAANPYVNPATRAVIKKTPNGNYRVKPGERVSVNPGDKFQVGPDRVKGSGEVYFGNKQDWRKRVIESQVMDVSANLFKGASVNLDDDCNWVVFDAFKLPTAWAECNPGNERVKLMLIFPDQYPEIPTNGFYLPSHIVPPAADRHFFDRGYSGAFGGNSEEVRALAENGWKWYCTHIKPASWSPARIQYVEDWRKGDNLWDILNLCKEVLTNPYGD